MSKISDNKKLVLINIPGTHDSTAYYLNCLGSCFAQTQYIDITSQLNIGVRIFDIRIHVVFGLKIIKIKIGQNQLYAVMEFVTVFIQKMAKK